MSRLRDKDWNLGWNPGTRHPLDTQERGSRSREAEPVSGDTDKSLEPEIQTGLETAKQEQEPHLKKGKKKSKKKKK